MFLIRFVGSVDSGEDNAITHVYNPRTKEGRQNGLNDSFQIEALETQLSLIGVFVIAQKLVIQITGSKILGIQDIKIKIKFR